MLARFVGMLQAETARQNLIAPSTEQRIWSRHIVDSAQLLDYALPGSWLDVGTGAGFPGVVIALLSERPVHLVEPRARRAAFLRTVVEQLDLASHVDVHACNVQSCRSDKPFAMVSARAVASLPVLFGAAQHVADANTTWLLPKGRSAAAELEAARATWQGDFRLVPSITDPESAIVVARNVRPRKAR